MKLKNFYWITYFNGIIIVTGSRGSQVKCKGSERYWVDIKIDRPETL